MSHHVRTDIWSFWHAYQFLLGQLLTCDVETNERTGARVRVLPGATSFGIDLSTRVLPTAGIRRVYPRVAAAEVAWYISGEQDATWMTKQAPIWDKFVEPLERLSLEGGFPHKVQFEGVEAAYGYRWRRHFDRDQLKTALQALHDNPSDRRVVICAWDPAQDGNGTQGQKNVPCPAMLTFNVVGGKLHSTMLLRSSDVFVGLPYDVLGHALLMDAIATELGVGLGIAHFTLAHAHLYEAHWGMAEEAIIQQPVVPPMAMPGWTVYAIEKDRDGYVQAVRDATALHDWPKFAPRPEVIA